MLLVLPARPRLRNCRRWGVLTAQHATHIAVERAVLAYGSIVKGIGIAQRRRDGDTLPVTLMEIDRPKKVVGAIEEPVVDVTVSPKRPGATVINRTARTRIA